MKNRELKRNIAGWLNDYEAMYPRNVQPDYDERTMEGSAALLLKAAKAALSK